MKYSAIDPPYLATKCSIRYYRNEADRVLCIKSYPKVIKHYCAHLHIAPTYIVQMNLICNFACQVSDILVFIYRPSERVGIPHEISTKCLWVISVTNCSHAKCLELLF
ncbi:MAG: hypothetical protein MRJ93_07975 [Nitrososphaeraceae archaeon]|nr:hypothetical protein [Nitrososphaeraceae archaeon]